MSNVVVPPAVSEFFADVQQRWTRNRSTDIAAAVARHGGKVFPGKSHATLDSVLDSCRRLAATIDSTTATIAKTVQPTPVPNETPNTPKPAAAPTARADAVESELAELRQQVADLQRKIDESERSTTQPSEPTFDLERLRAVDPENAAIMSQRDKKMDAVRLHLARQAAAGGPDGGNLAQHTDIDPVGRRINRFYGDIGVMMSGFRNPTQYMTGFRAGVAHWNGGGQ